MTVARRIAAAVAAALLGVTLIGGPASAHDTSWGGAGVVARD
jgi:hypothetical protein